MQSIFRLPWCADHISFRAGEKDAYAPVATSVDMSIPRQIKRKRAISSDPLVKNQSVPKKQRPSTAIATSTNGTQIENISVDQPFKKQEKETIDLDTAVVSDGLDHSKQESVATPVIEETRAQDASTRHTKLQQMIENQFNLQILLKHNELRLIDQEIAKCQVALEQLRRCELKPFPGQERFDYLVSSGVGNAISPSSGLTQPSHAAPHGVTDGPYTRHYRRWLLQDDQFDSRPLHMSTDDGNLAARSTRHAGARKSLPSSCLTPSRQSADFGLPTLPVPVPKRDSSVPLVLRRSTDNKLVKLVCNNCNRGNMSSIQGFLNHCRIAHKVVYESHDAAAIDCGREMSDSEVASLPTETQTMPTAKAAVRQAPSRAPSQTVPVVPVIRNAAVHPLNTPEANIVKTEFATTAAAPAKALSISQPSQFATKPFKASASLPKLSALFARRNAGGNLEQAAVDARRKSDIVIDDVLSPASLTPGSPASTPTVAKRDRASKKGPRHSYFAPASGLHHTQLDGVNSPEHNLSPNTVDSNPGLVSDVEDDDNGSVSEEETAPHHTMAHPLGISRTCAADVDIDVEDDLQQHGVIIRRNSMLGNDDALHSGGPSRKLGGSQH